MPGDLCHSLTQEFLLFSFCHNGLPTEVIHYHCVRVIHVILTVVVFPLQIWVPLCLTHKCLELQGPLGSFF